MVDSFYRKSYFKRFLAAVVVGWFECFFFGASFARWKTKKFCIKIEIDPVETIASIEGKITGRANGTQTARYISVNRKFATLKSFC